MRSIAVVGAGAAGLTASRHLVKCGLRPCIFEASSHAVGGSWNPESGAYKMWDHLTPNLSKYTCVFSDHPWDRESPTFPSRKDLNRYLIDYSAKYLMNGDSYFRMGCTVTGIKRCGAQKSSPSSSSSFLQPFRVEWTTPEGGTMSQQFDGVIVATGFFAKPWLPFRGANVLHSSDYRSPDDFRNQTVVVCGASFSALEIAADVRTRAARVVSTLPRVPYVLPRYVPTPGRAAGTFAPLDVALYQRRERAPQPHATSTTPEESQKKHAFLRELAGSRKQSALGGFPKDTSAPPFVAISDHYLNLVVDGNVEAVHGRVSDTTPTDDGKVSVQLEDGTTIEGVDKIIACTGYRSRLDFLEPGILETLQYNPEDGHAPLTLCNEAYHPKIPGLGFVGMYRGPYFGVMDLQARMLAGMMSGRTTPSPDYTEQALDASGTIRRPQPTPPQFPRGDYIGFMDQLAGLLGLIPGGEYGATGAMVSPPYYAGDSLSRRDWKSSIDQELQRDWSANMAQIVMSALIGKWNFRRSIVHPSSPEQPSHNITGVIDFSLIPPSDDDDASWNAAMYHEEGLLHLSGGKDLDVSREYVYEAKDNGILEIHFVEDGKRAHLFLRLKFARQQEDGAWIATSDHLCIEDLYRGTFRIALEGLSASQVTMTYRVKGPNKDYESVTELQPR